MSEATNASETQARSWRPKRTQARRNEKVGQVVSTKMQKTIVVEIEMRKAHPKYKRVMKTNKKFYAHDEQNSARVGDVVRIRETRPLSKLKRWQLEEIVRRSALAQVEEAAAGQAKLASVASRQVSGFWVGWRPDRPARGDEDGSTDENDARRWPITPARASCR